MARVVIADAGPLIAFAGSDHLAILNALFSEVFITDSVREEYAAKFGADTQRIDAGISEGWIRVSKVANSSFPLSPGLGRGESDSICLAMKDPDNSLLILDDRLARRYALRKGLRLVGTVRLLVIAQERGLINDALRCVHEMADIGYRISPHLLEKIRAAVG